MVNVKQLHQWVFVVGISERHTAIFFWKCQHLFCERDNKKSTTDYSRTEKE